MKENESKSTNEHPSPDLEDASTAIIIEELQNAKDQLMRALAENENIRRRMERKIDNAEKYAIQDFIIRLLPAKDSMEKGIDVSYMQDGISSETLFEGMTSTLRICNEAFKSAGLEEIDPLGKQFDPELHEAMAIKQGHKKANTVLSVYQKGYLLNGRLIRPARVEVSAVN